MLSLKFLPNLIIVDKIMPHSIHISDIVTKVALLISAFEVLSNNLTFIVLSPAELMLSEYASAIE